MKTIKITPNYYNEFNCTQINCPNTCCKGWLINIDKQTYSKYCKLTDDFSLQVLNKISSKNKQILMHKYYCPFLDDDMLCKIQKKYGSEYVCETCRKFPRVQKTFANITRHDLRLACPEVINIISSKNKLSYTFEDETNQQTNPIIKKSQTTDSLDNSLEFNFYLQFNQIISTIIKTNKNENKRLYIYLNFINDFAKQFKLVKFDYSKTEIFDLFDKSYFKKLSKSFNQKKDLKTSYTMFLNIEQNFDDAAIINEGLACFIGQNIFSTQDLNDNKKLKEFNKKYKKYFKIINKTINFSNILNYYIFSSSFNCFKDLEFETKSFFVFFMFYLYKFVLYKAFTIEKNLSKDKILIYLSSISRATEHSDGKDNIQNKLIKLKEFSLNTINSFLKSKI